MEIDWATQRATFSTREIGDYTIGLDAAWRLWEVKRRRDKKPVPAELSGKFTEPDEFETALAEYTRKQGASA